MRKSDVEINQIRDKGNQGDAPESPTPANKIMMAMNVTPRKKAIEQQAEQEISKQGTNMHLMIPNKISDNMMDDKKLKLIPENNDEQQPVEDEKLPQINYEALNGLRGLGAFAVFLTHYFGKFFKRENSMTSPSWMYYCNMTPLLVFVHGYFWVVIFFILSGFVLPLSFFKTKKPSCIFGATFRRYIRLMIPVLVIISLYYTVAKLSKNAYPDIKRKKFGDLIIDGLIGTWFGDQSYTAATWILSIELYATFFIYLVAFTAVNFRARYTIYLGIFVFIFTAQISKEYDFTNYGISKFQEHLPMFFIGMVLCDSEFLIENYRPLDSIRKLNIWWSILRNMVLVFMFASYGSHIGLALCEQNGQYNCVYWKYTTLDWSLPKPLCMYIGAVSIILLALVSPGFQWFLLTSPVVFMGKISYTFYLVHKLIIDWAMAGTAFYLVEKYENVSQNDAALYVFLIYLPPTILFSWLLEMAVDTPSKELAGEVDRAMRVDQGKDEYGQQKKGIGCWQFIKSNWKIWALIIWFTTIFIITELFKVQSPETSD